MLAILQSLGTFFIDLFKSRRRLEAENLFLGHQLSIALRRAPPRLRLRRWACHCGSDIMRNAKACERNDALRPVTPGLIRTFQQETTMGTRTVSLLLAICAAG